MTNTEPANHPPSLQPRVRRRRFRAFPWVLLGAIMVYMTMHYSLPHRRHLQAHAATITGVASTVQTIQSARDKAITALPSKVRSIISKYPGVDFSVSVIDLSNGKKIHVGDGSTFDAASTAKLITAADYLDTVEKHQHTLDEYLDGDTAQNWLERLIVDSDETAWQVINDTLTHEQMASYAKSIGMQNYDPIQNTATSDDVALLLQKLYSKSLLNDYHTSLLLTYMQQANYRDCIVAGVPSTATVYHKVGWDEDVLHDAAIVTDGSHSFVLVIYSSDDTTQDWDARTEAFQSLANAVSSAYLAN